jgi:hypothetical protein
MISESGRDLIAPIHAPMFAVGAAIVFGFSNNREIVPDTQTLPGEEKNR